MMRDWETWLAICLWFAKVMLDITKIMLSCSFIDLWEYLFVSLSFRIVDYSDVAGLKNVSGNLSAVCQSNARHHKNDAFMFIYWFMGISFCISFIQNGTAHSEDAGLKNVSDNLSAVWQIMLDITKIMFSCSFIDEHQGVTLTAHCVFIWMYDMLEIFQGESKT